MEGIKRTVDLALEINKRVGRQQITFMDLGGGLSVNFEDERDTTDIAPSFADYRRMLEKTSPELFEKKADGSFKYKVFTGAPRFHLFRLICFCAYSRCCLAFYPVRRVRSSLDRQDRLHRQPRGVQQAVRRPKHRYHPGWS